MRNGLIIDKDGTKWWYKNEKRNRLDGPAIEDIDGKKYWFYEGQYIECSSQEEFEHLIKLKILW